MGSSIRGQVPILKTLNQLLAYTRHQPNDETFSRNLLLGSRGTLNSIKANTNVQRKSGEVLSDLNLPNTLVSDFVLVSQRNDIPPYSWSTSFVRARHHKANVDPVLFIIGEKTAGANPTVASFPIANANPEPRPAFCKPTS